jgi:hypothetical protein
VPRSFLILVALVSALPAWATDIASVKCPVNQDRVWVYVSLSSFDVEAKLRCGETVEIVSRVKGYVQIRTANGVEGYVPDSVFPGLPPLEDDKDKVAPPKAAATNSAAPASVSTSAKTAAQPAPAAATPPVQTAVPVAAPAPPSPPAKPAAPAVRAAKKSRALAVDSTTQPVPPAAPAAQPSPAVVPAKASASPVTVTLIDSGAIVPPSRAIRAAQPAASPDDSDEYPDARVENDSADPACRIFFSAYGLAPSQFKWMADNRRKDFPGICPAPDPASVDFVILFTHDSNSYIAAMPTPVRVDRSGFSDFSPLTEVDTVLISPSQAEKARYEFVWVFRVERGAFDPAKFSPRRRPQFSTAESKGSRSAQIIEDAFHYIEGQPGVNR